MASIRFLSAGESHGPKLTVVVEGVPAGFAIDVIAINEDLARRQQGFGRGGRMKIESDKVSISAGIINGKTTGAPIAMEVVNLDFKSWKDKEIEAMTIPRPGHADLTGAVKYQHPDLRLSLERASARETTTRVCVGALCKQLLSPFGILIGGYIRQLGQVSILSNDDAKVDVLKQRIQTALKNEFASPELSKCDAIREEISACMKAKDTLGGIFEIAVLDAPIGLGSYAHWDRRLDGQLTQALMSIQAMKGVEIGPAFANATKRGTQVHDAMFINNDVVTRHTNRAGGLEGGVTTGEPILIRVAMKPISTTLTPLPSVNLSSGEASVTKYERSDFCALPRAVPIGEAMVAFVIANALFEKLGGDSLGEMMPRFATLAKATVHDLELDNKPWQMHYET